jgi:hypothetical protein
MIQSWKLNRVVMVSALVLSLSAMALAAAAPAAKPAEDPLKLIPANALFCVRINNLNNALGQTDMFLTGLFPAGVSMPVKSMLGQLLGSPEPVGVDMAGSFAVFGLASDGNTPGGPRIGILVPVSDYGKFAGGNPNIKPGSTQGVSKISAEGDGATALITQVGGYALAVPAEGSSDESLVAMKKTMTATATGVGANVDAAELKRAQSSAVWAYLNVPVVAKQYGAMLKSALQGIKAAMAAMPGQNAASNAQLDMALDMYSSMLDGLMNETRFITLTLDPSAGAIRAAVTVAALPNTGMADLFKGAPAQVDPKMLGYFRDGSAMNFAFTVDPAKMAKLNAMYLDMMIKFMGKDFSPEDIAAIKRMAADSSDMIGGTVVASLVATPQAKPPFDVRYIAKLKDQAKFNQMLDEAVKLMSPGGTLTKAYKDMGINMTASLKRKVANYKGVDIDSMLLTMTMTDANSPQNKQFAALYGAGVTVQFAATDGFLVYALAGDPNAALRELIDQVKAGGPSKTGAETQTALQLIPGADKGSMFATVNATRLAQTGLAISGVPAQSSQSSVTSSSDLALASSCGDGKAVLELAVPKQQVTEIMGVIMQLQVQQMMQQQQLQPPAQPGQTPSQPPQSPSQPRPQRGGRSTL